LAQRPGQEPQRLEQQVRSEQQRECSRRQPQQVAVELAEEAQQATLVGTQGQRTREKYEERSAMTPKPPTMAK